MSENSASASSLSDVRAKSCHVLYSDDVHELRMLMQHTLSAAGLEITCVPDGADAWAEVQKNPGYFNVVITDHHMPHMSGLELVKRLRATGFGGRIVVVSSELGEPTDLSYHELGVDALLKKPIKFSQLPELLHELTNRGAA